MPNFVLLKILPSATKPAFTTFKPVFVLFAIAAFAAASAISCSKEAPKTEFAEMADDEYIEPAVEVFREPADLKISYRKARNFNKASEALIVMGEEWASKMNSVSDAEKLKLTASYEKAQDDLVRKFGLNGMEEFSWIQNKALKESSNKDIFARAGVFSR